MRGAVIHVIVENGASLAGVSQKRCHLVADDGIDGIERAIHHNVIGLDVRIDHVQTVVGMIFIEDVLCIVLLVEECERHG